MRVRSALPILPVLLALAALVFLPALASGRAEERAAYAALSAGDQAEAARRFALAASRLPARPDLWEQAGLASLRSGRADQALLLLRRAGGSLSREGRLALGDAEYAAGDPPAALRIWQDLTPDADAYDRLARAYQQRGEAAEEIEALTGLLALRPEDARAQFRLGLLLAVSDPQASLRALRQAAQLDPAYDAPAQAMQLAINTAWVSEEPAYRYAVVGRGYGAAGEWDLAAAAFEQAVALRPDYAEAWAWLGEAREQSGGDGLFALGRALALDPDLPVAQVLSGLYWSRQGRFDLAVTRLSRAVELEPEDPAWRAALGEAQAGAGDLIAALDSFRQAAALAPSDPHYLRLLASFSLIYEVDVENIALPAAQSALALDPDDPLALVLAGQTYTYLGHPDEAERSLLRALELDPDLAAAELHLGLLYLQLGRRDAARQALLLAAEWAGPGDPTGRQAAELLARYFP